MADNTILNTGSAGDTIRDKDRAGVKTQIVGIDVGIGGTEALMSTTNPMPVETYDFASSGTITTQNLVPAGVATAGSAVAIALNSSPTLGIQVSGVYTGVLSLQGTVDGTNWVTIGGSSVMYDPSAGGTAATIASAAVGIRIVNVTGYAQVRLTGLAAMTGTATVTLRAIDGIHGITLDAQLPTGTAAIGTVQVGNTANTTPILANPLIPAVTTTGDTGAKVATGNGATQTNTTAKGATIVVNMGAVTGTTPTCVIKIQGSADAGTTWYDIPSATTASLVATGVWAIIVYPGITALAGTTVSGTAAASNVTLPRNWRIVWTIGGTTPSFTITNVQVSYHLT
jgi:hypothetical protein